MAYQRKVIGAGQTGDAGANDGNRLPGALLGGWDVRGFPLEIPLGGVAGKMADGDTLIVNGTAAALLARGVAEALEDRRERHVAPDGGDGVVHFLVLDLPNHAWHFGVNGAEPLAGRLTVADVFAQQQLESGFAAFANLLALGIDLHAVDHRGAAGGVDAASGLVFHLANHAGGEVIVTLLVAHHWYINACLFGCVVNCDRLVEL